MHGGCRVSSIALTIMTLVAAAAAMSPEELVVRSTYAKATVAFEIEQISSALYGDRDKFAKTEHLQIDVSSVTVGPIQDILQTNVEDLVTKPSGYVLDATVVMAAIPHSGKNRETFKSLTVAPWHVVPPLAQDWAVPVAKEMEIAGKQFSRYASFDVTITFMERQRQYKALFLFAPEGSKEPVYALDFILGMSAVNQLVSVPIQQEMQFLQSNFAGERHVRSLLQSVQPRSGCETDARSQFCCESATGHCGVQGLAPLAGRSGGTSFPLGVPLSASHSLAAASAAPACTVPDCSIYNTSGQVLNITADGNAGHWLGSHAGAATAQGKCTYSGTALPCTPLCRVVISTPKTGDDYYGVKGFPNYYHSLSYGRAIIEGTNSCTSYVGFGGIQCHVLFNCTISVSVGAQGVTVSPKDQEVWNSGNLPNSYNCNTIQ